MVEGGFSITMGSEFSYLSKTQQEIFNLSDVNSSPSKYSQDLLDWYNNKYLNFLTPEELIVKLKENSEVDFSQIKNGILAISLLAKGASSLNQIAEESIYFFEEPLISKDLLNIDSEKKYCYLNLLVS